MTVPETTVAEDLPADVERTFRCECGDWIGVSDHPATSYVDGRELGPLYLAEGHGRPFGRSLWRVGTGDDGARDQRCPNCDRLLSEPAAEQLGLGV